MTTETINITNTINMYNNLAFVCSCLEHVKDLIDLCEKENIVFSKQMYVEPYDGLYEKYSKHLSESHKSAVMIKRTDIDTIQLYTRTYKDWGKYTDWDYYHFIDYSAYIRDSKINDIISI